jgi:ATP-dependent Clp protease ATP-binding subunit ClpC
MKQGRPVMTLPDLRTEPELVALRRVAENLANTRRERVTSAHLLAAIASETSLAAELLAEKRLTADQLLRAARSAADDEEDALHRAEQHARELATRMRGPEPSALHLLVALLSVKTCAAYRVLDQFGVDVVHLRLRAMNIGLGRLQRRAPERALSSRRAITVPLTPKPSAIRPRTLSPNSASPTPAAPPADTKAPETPSTPKRTLAPVVSIHAPNERIATTGTPKPSLGDAKRAGRAKKKRTADGRFVLDAKRYKYLSEVGVNWCLKAELGELDVVERPEEVEFVLDVLAKKDANNPCLVGPSGVGKSALIQSLAVRIVEGAGSGLDDRILVEVRIADLIAGTGVRGALAERIDHLRRELAQADGRVVLVFEDLHLLFAPDVADECGAVLRRALTEGGLPCIGISTPDLFGRWIESDAALSRCFTRVDVDEPDEELCAEILERASERLAKHHHVGFEPEALRQAVAWSKRYVTERALPDKAIAIIDLAAARVRRRGGTEVDREQVARVVSERTAVPMDRLLENDGLRLLNLENALGERVVGHESALAKISRIVRRNAAGLGGNRPIGTFLLLGPTGVGKTETAKAIAFALFGSETALTRLDLSEYSEAHAVARLIGSPPGYVGHEAGGQLTEAVRRRPYQVLLLDEVEKAHPEVLETFLPLLDEGRLTDGRGRTVDFCNTVVVLTSNIGAAEAVGTSRRRVGFSSEEGSAKGEDLVIEAAKRALAPEFFNRLDEVLVFEPLSRNRVTEIARRLLQKLVDSVMAQRGVELRVDASVVELLLEQGGYDVQLGARPMKRAIARLVEGPLAECLLGANVPAALDITALAGSVVLTPAAEPRDDGTAHSAS